MSNFLLGIVILFLYQCNGVILTGSGTYDIDTGLSKQVGLMIEIDTLLSSVKIILSGPMLDWFAVGFGGQTMGPPKYVVAVGGNGVFVNRKTTGYGLTGATEQCTEVTNDVIGSTRTVTLDCALTGEFTFPTSMTTMDIIWAGTDNDNGNPCCFPNHSSFGDKGGATISLAIAPSASPTVSTRNPSTTPTSFPSNTPSYSPTDSTSNPSSTPSMEPTLFPSVSPLAGNQTREPSSAPSKAPTTSPSTAPSDSTITPTTPSNVPSNMPSTSPVLPNTECAKDEFGIASQEVNADPLFNVGILINCVFNRIQFIMIGPPDIWFGIVFGTSMASPDGNRAIIYSTGKDNSIMPAGCGEYSITETSSAGVARVAGQIQTDNDTVSDNRRTVICSLNLDDTNGDFSINTVDVTFGFAFGATGASNPFQLLPHIATSQSATTFNLITGTTESFDPTTLYILHGALLWVAWSVFGYLGIFMSRNRWLFDDSLWFKLHILFQVLCLLCQSAGVAMMILAKRKLEQSVIPQGRHEILGAIIIILALLQPINALCRGDHENRNARRIIWEIYHKSVGYLCLIGSQLAAYLGITYTNTGFNANLVDILVWVLIGYAGLAIIIFITFTLYGICCSESNDSHDKSRKHSTNIPSGDFGTPWETNDDARL